MKELEDEFKKETGDYTHYWHQEYSGATAEEHGYSEEFVEWLKNKLNTLRLDSVILSDKEIKTHYTKGYEDGANAAANDILSSI